MKIGHPLEPLENPSGSPFWSHFGPKLGPCGRQGAAELDQKSIKTASPRKGKQKDRQKIMRVEKWHQFDKTCLLRIWKTSLEIRYPATSSSSSSPPPPVSSSSSASASASSSPSSCECGCGPQSEFESTLLVKALT